MKIELQQITLGGEVLYEIHAKDYVAYDVMQEFLTSDVFKEAKKDLCNEVDKYVEKGYKVATEDYGKWEDNPHWGGNSDILWGELEIVDFEVLDEETKMCKFVFEIPMSVSLYAVEDIKPLNLLNITVETYSKYEDTEYMSILFNKDTYELEMIDEIDGYLEGLSKNNEGMLVKNVSIFMEEDDKLEPLLLAELVKEEGNEKIVVGTLRNIVEKFVKKYYLD